MEQRYLTLYITSLPTECQSLCTVAHSGLLQLLLLLCGTSSEATAGNASAAAAAAGDDDDHTGAGDVDGDVDDGFLHYDPDPNATTVAISLWERRRSNTGAGVSRAQDVKLLGHKNESLPMVTVKMNGEDKLVAPNRILTARIQPHIAIIMFYLPKNDDRSPPIHYVLQAFQDHPGAWEHFCRDCNVHMVAKLRDENNPMQPLNCNQMGGLATREWPCLVGFRTKQWTAQILETWAKKVAHKLQSVAHIKCRYPLPSEYAGDITPPIIQVLSYYLTVQDVLEALEQRIFPGMTLANTLEQQDMTVYFDNESLALARSHVATGRGGAAANGFYEPDVAQNYFHLVKTLIVPCTKAMAIFGHGISKSMLLYFSLSSKAPSRKI
ncbi:unnamed protein product [Cylindrotheca closterium]|uniref:Uncharacterized protein n=1 Tax=Cylindrotheca closterium TaxID=2856 RepID=A0AAD2CDR8_9STRA|nr:unnamed protein product [Cylindrotheca closterium]